MKQQVWVLSADIHKARLFAAATPHSKQIEEIKTFLHPDTVLPERELVSDTVGRYQNGAKLPRTSPKEKRIEEFARDVTEFLETAHKQGEFYKLGIVAAPHMLGELRGHFSPDLCKDLCFEINKNITQLGPDELRRHLPERLAPSASL
ncbi:MAG: host attachment protein [Cellvibrionaceae bacterium]|nr:host attachment protein [Cellvibrionaceae bacterium]